METRDVLCGDSDRLNFFVAPKLRAVTFQDNRSNQSDPASQKIAAAQDLADSLVLPEEVAAFFGCRIPIEARATPFANDRHLRWWILSQSPDIRVAHPTNVAEGIRSVLTSATDLWLRP